LVALAGETVTVIACPVDCTANAGLIRSLGDLDESLPEKNLPVMSRTAGRLRTR
jgi:hypothetical protein